MVSAPKIATKFSTLCNGALTAFFTACRAFSPSRRSATCRCRRPFGDDAKRKHFGIFADGTSNPWGLDFDPHGEAFLTACVIPHAFHMIPGGTYIRQAVRELEPLRIRLAERNQRSHPPRRKRLGSRRRAHTARQPDSARISRQLAHGQHSWNEHQRDEIGRAARPMWLGTLPIFSVSGDKNFRPVNIRWGLDARSTSSTGTIKIPVISAGR